MEPQFGHDFVDALVPIGVRKIIRHGTVYKGYSIIVSLTINNLKYVWFSVSPLSMTGELPHNLKAIQVFMSPEGDLLCSDVDKDLLLQYLLCLSYSYWCRK